MLKADNSMRDVYRMHHSDNRDLTRSIMSDERGILISKYIGKGKEVLDIGCRNGVLTAYFSDGNKVLGVDIDEVALNEAKEKLGIETMQIDLNSEWNEIQNGKYDAVVAGEVVEHLYFPKKILGRVVKKLKKDGMFLGSVPNAFSLKNRIRYAMGKKRFTPLEDPTHINHFSVREMESLLKNYFNDVEIVGVGRYGKLAKIFPKHFAFDIFWCAKNPK